MSQMRRVLAIAFAVLLVMAATRDLATNGVEACQGNAAVERCEQCSEGDMGRLQQGVIDNCDGSDPSDACCNAVTNYKEGDMWCFCFAGLDMGNINGCDLGHVNCA